MFQNPLRQAARRARPASLSKPCINCQCVCERSLTPQIQVTQKRFARKSPAVLRKLDAKEDARLAGVKPLANRLAEMDETHLFQAFKEYTRGGSDDTYLTNAALVKRFAVMLSAPGMRDSLYDRTQGPHGSGSIVDAISLRNLQADYELNDKELALVGILVRNMPGDFYEFLGNALLFSAASAGNQWAIICLMDNAYEAMKHVPNVFEYRQTGRVRKGLEEIALQGKNYRAAVLAGKILNSEGKYDRAVEFFKLGIDGAVEASELARQARINRHPSNISSTNIDERLAGSSLADLSAPWVELATYYMNRKDWTNAKWAIAIGCEQDDPNSHYHASLFEKGTNSVRSTWFHHITKAATSGHVRAMHELGLWYAQDGWPYLEDEPPDNIKPTPFDRFPASKRWSADDESLGWQRLLVSLGLQAPVASSIAAQTFQTAAYPTTPVERYGMALEWMNLAMGFYYAPAYLATATLLLEEKLYPDAATPKEALELSDSRYTHASREDYNANKPIERQNGKGQEEIPNPYYNPQEAKRLTREIFYAAIALELQRDRARRQSTRKIGGDSSPETIYEGDLASDMGANLKKWYKHPEVRELFMNERTGKMFDPERNNMDLLKEAKLLCDERQWDLYGEDGSLLYRHGMRKQAR